MPSSIGSGPPSPSADSGACIRNWRIASSRVAAKVAKQSLLAAQPPGKRCTRGSMVLRESPDSLLRADAISGPLCPLAYTFEAVGVGARQVDVAAPILDRLGDVGALAELVPGLDGQDVVATGECLTQLALVEGAVLAVDVEAVPLRSTVAVGGIAEPRPNFGHVELGVGIEPTR